MEMSKLTRDETAEPISRDQILRRERGQRNIHDPCSAHHEQDWQPYPVDPYSCYLYVCVGIHTYIIRVTVGHFYTECTRPNIIMEGKRVVTCLSVFAW